MNPLIQFKNATALCLLTFALAGFGLSPTLRAADETTSNANTGEGIGALQSVTTGAANTAVGFSALFTNMSGNFNTATGAGALANSSSDGRNTATGAAALFTNNGGAKNTADGVIALFSNTSGNNNTAVGDSALSLTTGDNNTGVGEDALEDNTSGSYNIALGQAAGGNLTTGNNNIDIYDRGVAGEANTIRIGTQGTQTKTIIAGISGETSTSGIAVLINSSGVLGTTTSSKRFKEDIKPMDKASEAILVLKPVTFRYKRELDPEGIQQFGLVAEDVQKVNPALVALDKEGKPYAVRYEQVNAMLLNEFLKAHRQIEEQQKEIEALRGLIQKVSDKVEMNKPAPQTVLNNH